VLTFVGEAAMAVAHLDILTMFGFDPMDSNGLKPKFLIGLGLVLIQIVQWSRLVWWEQPSWWAG